MTTQANVAAVLAKSEQRIADAPQLANFDTLLQLKLTGELGGDWFFDCTVHPRCIRAGIVNDPVTTMVMDAVDFVHLINGQLALPAAYESKLQIAGNAFIARTLLPLLIDPPDRTAVVSLREITIETLQPILDLKVTPAQEKFVATNAVSIAQAHFVKEAWFRSVYAAETPVGFVMLHDDAAEQTYFLWRFMIDARYQGLGFGRHAIERLIGYVKTRPGATELRVSCVPGDGSPCPFYEKLGFQFTGEEHHGELVLRLPL